jgi:hypothetical protein
LSLKKITTIIYYIEWLIKKTSNGEKINIYKIKEIIHNTKNNKTTKTDKIPSKAYKDLLDATIQKIVDIFNICIYNYTISKV